MPAFFVIHILRLLKIQTRCHITRHSCVWIESIIFYHLAVYDNTDMAWV